jgi:hypothetical protein
VLTNHKHNITQCTILKSDNMAYSPLTEQGKNFIKHVCIEGMKPDRNGNTLLSGKQSHALPFTTGNTKTYDSSVNHIWTCNIKYNGNNVINGNDLTNALIYWFNYYAQIYDLDANVIAAQAYIESRYKMWIYVDYIPSSGNYQSTASGINQFLMNTIYDIIIKNNGKNYNSTHPFTPEEVNKIINGLTDNKNQYSYTIGGSAIVPNTAYQNSWHNRPFLHQNVIDNPDIMIKAQCLFMRYIADLCNAFTSSALFGYSRGPGYAKKTYTDSIVACKNGPENRANPNYLQEGLNYVLLIFGVLGDKDNFLASKGLGNYKPAPKNGNYYYFGYDDFMGDSPKNLRLKQTFDIGNANISQSNPTPPSIA